MVKCEEILLAPVWFGKFDGIVTFLLYTYVIWMPYYYVCVGGVGPVNVLGSNNIKD